VAGHERNVRKAMNAAASQNFEVSVETAAGLERRITVRVPAAEIEREIDARLVRVGKTAKLKGFRPGKVPQKVVRQRYGLQVREEVLSDVIRSSYSRAIEQTKLNPAGGPRIEPLAADGTQHGEHFAYRATFEVYPEIELASLEALSIEVPKIDVEQSDVEAMIEKLRAQRAEWKTVERKAEPKDRLVVDYAGTIDKQPFEGGEGKEVPIVLGGGQVLEDFDKALKGLAAGDRKSFKIKFPKDYPAENLAGRKAAFDVTVHRVEEQVLPLLDEAFAQGFGVTEGGVEALATQVRGNMQRELDERIRATVKTRTFDALIKANDIAVPTALVEQEIGALQAEAMRQSGIDDPAQAPPRDRFVGLARRRVTLSLLIQELIRIHGIKLERGRVEQRIEELVAAYEKPEEAAQFYRSNRGLMTQIESAVLEDQVVDFVLERADTKDKAMSFAEFMNA
jgi:trigger factor